MQGRKSWHYLANAVGTVRPPVGFGIRVSKRRGHSMLVLGFRSVGVAALSLSLFGMLSCARDQQLVAISVSPSIENFGGPDPTLNVQLRALGQYIHPPVTKDITDQVTWSSNTPGVAVVNTTGLL